MNKIVEENLKPRTIIAYVFIGLFVWKTVTVQDPTILGRLIDLLINIVIAQQAYYYGTRNASRLPEGGVK
jgi:hypothetical protein